MQGFQKVVGHQEIITHLQNAISMNKVSHAYLFGGESGSGKKMMASLFAMTLQCEKHGVEPCMECPSCKKAQSQNHPDIIYVKHEKPNTISIDEIREQLINDVMIKPYSSPYKIYIIDEVQKLTLQAQNALLKTLEEPPAHAVFILATTEPQRLPATILSRCQRFDFGRIPVQQIVGRLQEAVQGAGGTATDQALHLIARAAEGGMRDALSILDMCLGYHSEVTEDLVRNVLGTADRSFLFRFGEALQASDVKAAMAMIDELMRGGREPVVFSKDVSQHLRALLMAQSCGEELAGLLELTQEDAEDFYALWQGQGQITLLEANTRYVADDLTLRGTDAMLKLRGERYVAGNLTLMDTVTPAHLAGMGRLWVTGTLMLPEALLDTVLPRLANEPELVPYQGKLLVDEEKMELGEAELSAYTQGVTLLVQGQLDLREDLAPEVLREKVRLLYNCGQVILNAEQQAALLPVTINQGYLSLRKAETEKTQPQANPDECVLGDMAYLEM